VLGTWADDYIRVLDGTRYLGDPASQEAHHGINRLIGLMSAAWRRAVSDATAFEQRLAALQSSWRTRQGRVRTGSAVGLPICLLPGAPILTMATAAELIGRSGQAADGQSVGW